MSNRKTKINAWHDTQSLFTKGALSKTPKGESFSVAFQDDFTPPEKKYQTSVIVSELDTLVMTENLVSEGFKPLVLNMASDYHPGGGVSKGASAQEEELFRRTNYGVSISKSGYPLVNKAILTRNILVIKDTNYKLLPTPFQADFLACAALRRPLLVDDEYNKWDYAEMYKRIFNIFDIAVENGNDSLVLGAFGCGAFQNPPYEVAKIFKRAIDFYQGAFKKIGFAVLKLNTNNYEIFKEQLE